MVIANGITKDGLTKKLPLEITKNNNVWRAVLKKEHTVNRNIENISFISDITKTGCNNNGYMFYPTTPFLGCVLTKLIKRKDAQFTSHVSWIPTAGICNIESAVLVIIKGMAEDSKFSVAVNNNVYTLTPQIELNGDDADEDIVIEYHFLPNATYSDMAKIYREYQINQKGLVPLSKRVESNEILKKSVDSIEFRIRMGWKPVPSPVLHQTIESEPPLKVVCDIEKTKKIITEMKRQGIENAQICLVGWSKGGHDGRYPQNFPLDERYGSEEDLKKLIEYAKSLGYLIVCYTNSVCAFEIADNWDADALTYKKDEQGNLYPLSRGYNDTGGLSGGYVYHLCADRANKQYAQIDLPKIADYGFEGLHFVDEITFCVPEKCYHPNHPVSRKEAYKNYHEIAKLSKKTFGGFQSEGWLDHFNSDVDYILYTAFLNDVPKADNQLFDELIPFWQLVYHGIVMSNPNSTTVNYTLKGATERLKFIEWGGRPLMYLYSKFGDEKNWMGDIDLRCDNDEDISLCVAELKKAYDEYTQLKDLQYAFMSNHQKVENGVYRVDYSDGTTIEVNYNKGCYSVYKNGKFKNTINV